MTLRDELEGGDATLVDVREHAEHAGGRVSGAKLMPLGELESRHKELDHKRPVYVMCRSGNRSAKAQKELHDLGFENVINVSGGFEEWKRHDLPFEKDERAPWDIERQVRFVAGSFVLLGFLLAVFVHPYLIGISAFIGAGLVFSALTNTCTMGMVLLKMPWNRVNAQPACDTQ
jgi:rhodanese-related sulfurtransferase